MSTTLAGVVRKRGQINTAFAERYFVLAAGVLKYYASKKELDLNKKPRGELLCKGLRVGVDWSAGSLKNGFEFTITDARGKRVVCSVPREADREIWVAKLKDTAAELEPQQLLPPTTGQPGAQTHPEPRQDDATARDDELDEAQLPEQNVIEREVFVTTPYEKIVEKEVLVPVPYEKIVTVEVPIEKIKYVDVPVPYMVNVTRLEVRQVPQIVERLVEVPVHINNIVHKEIPVGVVTNNQVDMRWAGQDPHDLQTTLQAKVNQELGIDGERTPAQISLEASPPNHPMAEKDFGVLPREYELDLPSPRKVGIDVQSPRVANSKETGTVVSNVVPISRQTGRAQAPAVVRQLVLSSESAQEKQHENNLRVLFEQQHAQRKPKTQEELRLIYLQNQQEQKHQQQHQMYLNGDFPTDIPEPDTSFSEAFQGMSRGEDGSFFHSSPVPIPTSNTVMDRAEAIFATAMQEVREAGLQTTIAGSTGGSPNVVQTRSTMHRHAPLPTPLEEGKGTGEAAVGLNCKQLEEVVKIKMVKIKTLTTELQTGQISREEFVAAVTSA